MAKKVVGVDEVQAGWWSLVWRTLAATVAIFGLTAVATWATVIVTKSSDPAGWFSAIGTTLAIVFTLVAAALQMRQNAVTEQKRRNELVVVAYTLTHEALTLVTSRLDVALSPGQPGSHYELREHRTTETSLALREIAPHSLPPLVFKHFVQARSRIYAINARISDVYAERHAKTEEAKRGGPDRNHAVPYDMTKELSGAANVQYMALQAFRDFGLAGQVFGVTPETILVPQSVSSHPAWQRAASATARTAPRGAL